MDLIGPIYSVSDNSNQCILRVVDFETQYTKALALPKKDMERVADPLLDVFYRVGQAHFHQANIHDTVQFTMQRTL